MCLLDSVICIAETERGIFDAILKEDIDFESQPWPSITSSAKDLVRKMLNKDPKQRISAAQVLGMHHSQNSLWTLVVVMVLH